MFRAIEGTLWHAKSRSRRRRRVQWVTGPPSSGSAYSLSSQWISGAGCRRRWDFGPDGRAHLARRAAIAVLVVVIQAGHSGSRAVWSDYPNLRP